jgi:hypothetical protein
MPDPVYLLCALAQLLLKLNLETISRFFVRVYREGAVVRILDKSVARHDDLNRAIGRKKTPHKELPAATISQHPADRPYEPATRSPVTRSQKPATIIQHPNQQPTTRNQYPSQQRAIIIPV